MATPDNKFPLQNSTGDPRTNKAEQDVITNNDEAGKIVNNDNSNGSAVNNEGVEETLNATAPSAAVAADNAAAPDQQTVGSETATDADIAGGNTAI